METTTYHTLEEIQLRRDQLHEAIEHDTELIGTMWDNLFKKQEDSTRAEYITSIVANSITAIDTFLMVRKLIKNYGNIFSFFRKGEKKKRKR